MKILIVCFVAITSLVLVSMHQEGNLSRTVAFRSSQHKFDSDFSQIRGLAALGSPQHCMTVIYLSSHIRGYNVPINPQIKDVLVRFNMCSESGEFTTETLVAMRRIGATFSELN